MREINQTITAVKVKSAEAEETEAANAPTTNLNENIQRPEMLIGSTYKIKPPISDHALYITINDILLNQDTEQEIRRPFEIFVNSKNMEFYSWVVALTRVISAVFRKGGDCTFLVEELKAVFDPKGGYYQRGTGIFMPSVVADIGHTIETHLKTLDMLPSSEIDAHQQAYIQQKKQAAMAEQQSEQNAFPATASKCAKCHQKSVVLLDGCATCLNCGDSKCG
ncbi:NrdJb [Thalassotalea sp. G2M2-11]|uniref:TSCPD domain-containing protein n=1 Tax=Thalassotalea sp. G2M2-11 TaxID=2787627 RepID=UPI0019D1CF34|nr:NrdJb [Thalassotalea sp. G2M2-11]